MMTATETPIAADPTVAVLTTAPVEPSDEALIAQARSFNKAMERHLRKGIEAFWKLGESLAALYKRRHLHADGRWATVLKEVGVSTTTDNHARRLYAGCESADLALYKHKTQALRSLGILATPEAAKKAQTDGATKPAVAHGDAGPMEAASHDHGEVAQENRVEHTGPMLPGDEGGSRGRGNDDVQSLLTLSRIATLLEALADRGIAPADDDLAQLDRIVAAAARMKGVALVAAA